ncbi:hypothetical protein HDU98_009207 [Podochytrium sp. JEL0797]|nr:hypothetical protein HDU98_009207 [Podochytrium sp. JEL0797]
MVDIKTAAHKSARSCQAVFNAIKKFFSQGCCSSEDESQETEELIRTENLITDPVEIKTNPASDEVPATEPKVTDSTTPAAVLANNESSMTLHDEIITTTPPGASSHDPKKKTVRHANKYAKKAKGSASKEVKAVPSQAELLAALERPVRPRK